MSQHNKETGQWGEDLAREHLIKNGYEVLFTNWRFHHAEVDIICKKGGMTVFVEVKSRKTGVAGNPEEDVHSDKQKKMIFAAEGYVDKFDLQGELRFDIIAITETYGKVSLTHIEDAFYPYA